MLTHPNKVYADQMNHVRKGCLARKRQDIRSDGSRVEGSHKGWNSLQRAQPSGLVVFIALGHGHVLRRNILIVTAGDKSSPFNSFDTSTFGSHHIRLVNYTAKLWNRLRLSRSGSSLALLALPEMTAVSSSETFGLVNSECATTFAGPFSEVEAEPKLEDSGLLTLGPDSEDLNANLEDERSRVVEEFGIDARSFNLPMARAMAGPPPPPTRNRRPKPSRAHGRQPHSLEARGNRVHRLDTRRAGGRWQKATNHDYGASASLLAGKNPVIHSQLHSHSRSHSESLQLPPQT